VSAGVPLQATLSRLQKDNIKVDLKRLGDFGLDSSDSKQEQWRLFVIC